MREKKIKLTESRCRLKTGTVEITLYKILNAFPFQGLHILIHILLFVCPTLIQFILKASQTTFHLSAERHIAIPLCFATHFDFFLFYNSVEALFFSSQLELFFFLFFFKVRTDIPLREIFIRMIYLLFNLSFLFPAKIRAWNLYRYDLQ